MAKTWFVGYPVVSGIYFIVDEKYQYVDLMVAVQGQTGEICIVRKFNLIVL